jgi:hypothetical protein
MADTMSRMLSVTQELGRAVLAVLPGDHPIRLEVSNMHGELQRSRLITL